MSTSLSVSGHAPHRVVFNVNCFRCSAVFDAMTAEWCRCLVKERTVLCPSCANCFCSAPRWYKQKFWVEAPQQLWVAKVQEHERTKKSFLAPPPPDAISRPLVMVVDDDPEILAGAERLLGALGISVIVAKDGLEGLNLSLTYRPDLVITDALIPKIDGRELCRQIKTHSELATIPVVVMSSVYTTGKFKREALTIFHADEFLPKPISATSMCELLGRYLPIEPQPSTPVEPALQQEISTSEASLAVESVQDPEATAPLNIFEEMLEVEPNIVPATHAERVTMSARADSISIQEKPREKAAVRQVRDDVSLPAERFTAAALAAIGIDAPWLKSLRAAGYPDASVTQIARLAWSGIHPDEIHDMNAGVEEGPIPLPVAIELISKGVRRSWLSEVAMLAGRRPTVNEVILLASIGTSLETWRRIHAYGQLLAARDVILLHIAGADLATIEAIMSANGPRAVDDLLRAADRSAPHSLLEEIRIDAETLDEIRLLR